MTVSVDLWPILVDALNHPFVRVATTVLAVASGILGIWASRKAQRVLHAHEQQIVIGQHQLLDEQWQAINHAMLSNDRAAEAVAGMLKVDIALLRRNSFQLTLANLLASAWAAHVRKVIPEEIYVTHFNGVAFYFSNRHDLFEAAIPAAHYSDDFLKDCKRRFATLKPLSPSDIRTMLGAAGP